MHAAVVTSKDNLVNTGMASLVQCFPKKQSAKPKLNQKYDHQAIVTLILKTHQLFPVATVI